MGMHAPSHTLQHTHHTHTRMQATRLQLNAYMQERIMNAVTEGTQFASYMRQRF